MKDQPAAAPHLAPLQHHEYPEIEYMPPRAPSPPFVPEGFEPIDLVSLRKNLMRGCHRAYLAGIDASGKTALQRKVEANQRRLDAELDEETDQLVAALGGKRREMPPPPQRWGVESVRSRSRPASAAARSGPLSAASGRKSATGRRPGSAASNGSAPDVARPTAASRHRAAARSREREGRVAARRPLSFSAKPVPAAAKQVKRKVFKMESTVEAMERLKREDEEAEKEVRVLPEDEEVVVDYPSPLAFEEEEEEFVMTMPM